MIAALFTYLIYLAWAAFAIIGLLYLRYHWRRRGLWPALRRLCSWRLLLPGGALLALTLLRASLVFIYPQEAGVVVSLLEPNGYRPNPLRSGLHWVVPLAESVERYPIYRQTYTMSYRPAEGNAFSEDEVVARTADGQVVRMDISIVFSLDPERVVDLHIAWQHRYIRDAIRPGLRGRVREIVSQFTVDEINSDKRNVVNKALNDRLKEITQPIGITTHVVFIRNISFSPIYAESVEVKQVALQGRTRSEHEAVQIENLAQGQAQRIQIMAEAKAEAIRVTAAAEAQARVVRAEAEAEALKLVAGALEGKRDLLTYRYIDKISPNLQVMLLPHANPLLLPQLPQGLMAEPKPAAARASTLSPTPLP